MKKLIFILSLLTVSLVSYGQLENQLTMKASSAATDTVRVVKDGESALMLRSTFLSAVEDSITKHTDTLQLHQDQIAAIGAGENTFENGITEAGGVVKLGGDLTGTTTVDSETYTLTFTSDPGAASYASSELTSGQYIIHAEVTASGEFAEVNTSSNQVRLYADDGVSEYSGIDIGAGGDLDIYFTDFGLITDAGGTPVGLVYDDDYSANFTNRSLVDKEYVDSVAGAYTFTNGIVESGGTVALGDTLTGITTLEITPAVSNFTVQGANSGGGLSTRASFTTNSMVMQAFNSGDYTGNEWGRLLVQPQEVALNVYTGSGVHNSIAIRDDEMIVTDHTNTKGLIYNADYSANATARSLLDSAHIASMISGGVTKVGTPVNDQIGVWTGDGTIEGEEDVTFDGNILALGAVGKDVGISFLNDGATIYLEAIQDGSYSRNVKRNYTNTASWGHRWLFYRYGGSVASPTAAPTDADLNTTAYYVYDGTSTVLGAQMDVNIDGVVATGDFDTKYEWSLKEGASASALGLTLGVDGLEYDADHSTDQAANGRWIPDKEYVDGVAGGYTFANGLSESGGTAVLGGDITQTTYVTNDGEDYTFRLRGAYSSKSSFFTIISGKAQLSSFTNETYSAANPWSTVLLDGDAIMLSRGDGGDTDGISINDAAITITDESNDKGAIYADDYAGNYTDRSLPDVEYVANSSQRVMHVIEAEILYSNTSQTTIITVPADAILWDIQVDVRTGFNGSGTDLLDVGITGAANHFEDDLDIAATGFKTMSLTNVPYRVTGSTNITFQYFDSNADAAAGQAYVYVNYSLH